jgi:hypothetical protein
MGQSYARDREFYTAQRFGGLLMNVPNEVPGGMLGAQLMLPLCTNVGK